MPPRKRIERQMILDTAFKIARDEGLKSVNARSIAKKMCCSIQPIFSNFSNMDELKNEIILKMLDIYHQYMDMGINQELPYKGMGMAYINFAKNEPEIFKIFFMSEQNANTKRFVSSDDKVFKQVILQGCKATGLDEEQMEKFHLNIWIFTHGIATLLATKTCDIEDKEIKRMLTEMYIGQLARFEKGKKNGKDN